MCTTIRSDRCERATNPQGFGRALQSRTGIAEKPLEGRPRTFCPIGLRREFLLNPSKLLQDAKHFKSEHLRGVLFMD